MVKVILHGSQQTQWNIDGHYKPGSVPVELTEEEIAKHAKIIRERLDGKKIEAAVEKPAEKPKPKKPKKVK